MNITDFVLEQRKQLMQAIGVEVVEKVNRKFPFGNWKHPVEVWIKPRYPGDKGLHVANYWLSYPRKGAGKTVKFNISTFESVSKWLKPQPNPQHP